MAEERVNRRSVARVRSLNLVSVAQFDEQGFRSDLAVGRTLDISSQGVRVELNRALPLRSTVRLSLALGHSIIEIEGTVCHLEVLDDRKCSMGLQFERISDEDLERIEAYLSAVTTPAS
jgi:hypothetical protein